MTRSPANPRPQTTPSVPVSPSFSPHPGNRVKTACLLIAAAVGMTALLSQLPAAGHDQLWFLLMADRWLHGAVLYGPQLFDSNPPLIVWLSAIPVLIGKNLHLPPTAIGKLLVLLLEAAIAALSLHLLRLLRPSLTRLHTTFLAFAYVCIFAIVPARDLGQRDHLTAILCLPYVLAAAADPRNLPPIRPSRLLRPLCGALAALGICLKPHQALIPIAVELALLWTWNRRRDRSPDPAPPHRSRLHPLLRPEPFVLLLAGAAFVLAIHHLTPAYFTLALPTLRDTYWAIGHLSRLQLLAQAPQLHILAALTLSLFLWSRRFAPPDPLRNAIALLLIAATAATLAYYLQGTGWYYQQLPAISLFAAALALQLLAPPSFLYLPDSPRLPAAAATLSVIALALTTHFTRYPFTPDRAFDITSPDTAFFKDLPPGTPVAILSTSVEETMMPVARYHLLWSQRTNNLWTLPALLRSEDPHGPPPRHSIPPARLAELEHQQHLWMVEDLSRWHPALILVARCQDPEVHCQVLEDRHDNLLTWFERDPAFRNLWQHYHFLRTSGDYDAYTLKAPAPTPST